MTPLISFKITERPDLHFRPFAVDGTEGLSQLYKFDIDCFGDLAKRPDTLDLIGKRAVLRFELEGAAPREVCGIIKTITSGAPSMYGDARYRFQLVPWLERLNYSRASQIHGTNKEVSVVDVLEAELQGGLRRETRVADTDFRIFEHELRLKNRDSYPKRDHLVQYEETDFAFISRLAEHHGIYYFFENADGVEKVVFADDNFFTKTIDGDSALDWKPWNAGSRAAAPDTIQEMNEIARMIPRRMWMLDYNYRLPHVPLLARAEIDRRGLGNWAEYGSHHRTPAEGETLARIRAEEMRSNQRRWTGRSAVARLSPGRSFALKHHPYADWNQEYLVISVHHEVRVPMPGVELTEDWAGYRNSFEAIQQSTTFRPARVTPTPRMDGLLNARIDGAGQRDKAELDEQGRYRVRVPFDNSDTPDGKGSQWVRMASPFGGDGDGMHFPLAPDTEVVVACVNGDPNRPIILGAVPNPRNKSVVTRENSLRNRMVTRTGMGFEMGADGNSGGGRAGGGGSASNNVATQSAYGAAPTLDTPNAFGFNSDRITSDDAAVNPSLESPSALMAVDDNETNNYVRVYNKLDGSYVRYGANPGSTEPSRLKEPKVIGHLPIQTIDWPSMLSKEDAANPAKIADMSGTRNPPLKEDSEIATNEPKNPAETAETPQLNPDGTPVYDSIESIEVTKPGTRYTSVPKVTISPPNAPGGTQATAEAVLEDKKDAQGKVIEGQKFVGSITVSNHGSGYTSIPSITISEGGGTGAEAKVNLMRPKLKNISVHETESSDIFDYSKGIYATTDGDFYANIGRNTGFNSNGEIILQSARDTTLKSKNLYTSAEGAVQHLAGENLEIYAAGDIIIRAGGKIEMSANQTMSQDSKLTDTEVSFSDTIAITWGNSSSVNHGTTTETNYGNSITKNYNSEASFTVGASASMTLGAEFNLYFGSTLGISAGTAFDLYIGAIKFDLSASPLTVEMSTGITFKLHSSTEMEWGPTTIRGVLYEAYIKTIEAKLAAIHTSSTATSAQTSGTQATSNGANVNAGGPGMWARLVQLFA